MGCRSINHTVRSRYVETRPSAPHPAFGSLILRCAAATSMSGSTMASASMIHGLGGEVTSTSAFCMALKVVFATSTRSSCLLSPAECRAPCRRSRKDGDGKAFPVARGLPLFGSQRADLEVILVEDGLCHGVGRPFEPSFALRLHRVDSMGRLDPRCEFETYDRLLVHANGDDYAQPDVRAAPAPIRAPELLPDHE